MKYSPPPVVPASGLLRAWQRVLLALAGIALAVPLVLASRLTPSPKGMGTHQQLGLPACSAVQLFGVRCPACGMTTSWAWMLRGRIDQAVKTNAGGALLAMIAAPLAPWLLACGVRGRWVFARPSEGLALVLAVAVVAVTLVDWFVRLRAGW